MFGTVDMRTEYAAFLCQFPDRTERKDLKATAVSQDGPVPGFELMQSTGSLENVQSWTKVEVVGVPENDFRPDIFFKVAVIYAFDRTYRSHGHKDRCFYLPVVGGNQSASC